MLFDFQQTQKLLAKYQIPLVESLLMENLEQGVVFANRVGFPVVLKLLSPDTLHKIDQGLVKLNLQNEQDLEATWKELNSFLEGRSLTPSQVVVQKQISGVELLVGMKRDKSFGPVISFGLGGIFVEVLNDIVLAVCPVSQKEAKEMIKSIKGYKILQGYRGQTSVNLQGLADTLVNVSKMAIENENIKEIDFNPIIANESNIFIVDPKIIIGQT